MQPRHFENAVRLFQDGDVPGALAEAEAVLAGAPLHAEAHHLVALCHVRLPGAEAAAKAECAFHRALELCPGHPHVLANFATLLRRLGRANEAMEAWEQAVDALPDFAQAWTDLGITALRIGRPERATHALERATLLAPTSATAWHALGNARRANDDCEGAEAAFRKAVALEPRHRGAWINLGIVLRLLGRPAESLECYARARAAGEQSPEFEDAIVGALVDTGQIEDALARAREVVRRHPDFVPGHVTLSHLLWEHGPRLVPDEEPLSAFVAAARRTPDNLDIQLALIRFLLGARQGEAALERIGMLRRSNGDQRLKRLHADTLELLGRPGESGVLYAQLCDGAGDNDPGLLNAYVRHLLKAGEWKLAARRATEAIGRDAHNQEAWAYLGTAWRLLGDPREYWLCDYERAVTLTEVELPAEFATHEAFLAALKTCLEGLHQAARAPAHQSVRGGTQTSGRLFGRPDPVIEATQRTLMRAVERWLGTLPSDPGHPFLRRNAGAARFSGSWSVRLWSSGNHVNHIHPQGWMSSAFYVALPRSVEGAAGDMPAGALQLGQPPVELALDLPPRRVLRPAPGKLALFPSYLWHGTVPFADAEPRLTVAFDMQPAR